VTNHSWESEITKAIPMMASHQIAIEKTSEVLIGNSLPVLRRKDRAVNRLFKPGSTVSVVS
jgi:hypothetical protein